MLTPAWQRLRDDLAPAYRQIQEAIARAVANGKVVSGTLRVGFSSQWAGDTVLKATDVFRDRHPVCALRIQEVQLTDPFGPLRAGELNPRLTEFAAEPSAE